MAGFRFVAIEVMNFAIMSFWLREMDLNHRPPGYEPGTLPTALSRVCSFYLFAHSASVPRMDAQYAYLNRESQSSYENISYLVLFCYTGISSDLADPSLDPVVL